MTNPVGEYIVVDMLKGHGSQQVFWDAREAARLIIEKTPQEVLWDPREAGGLPGRGRRDFRDTQRQTDLPTMRDPGEGAGAGMDGVPGIRITGLTWIGNGWLPTVADLNWFIVGTGDFNADGKVDILWRNYGAGLGYNVVWYMDGVTLIGTGWLPTVADTNWIIAGTGDFNADGKVDILWRNYGPGTGYNVVWYMDGVTLNGPGWLPTVADLNWNIVGTGDFNADGKVDILWRNYGPGTGYNVVWYMDGVTLNGPGWLPTVTDTNWKIEGAGDFNADGKMDILWRNYGAGLGYNVVWYMDGVTLTGSEWLPTVADTNWRMENH
jgi:hypothetical protein